MSLRTQHGAYELDDDVTRINFNRVQSWLTTTYWSPGIALEKVQRAAEGASLVLGVYQRNHEDDTTNQQAGYLHVV